METSSNFYFNLPQSSDKVDISKLTANWKTVDTELSAVKTRGESNELFIGSKSLLNTENTETIVGAINEVDSHADTNASNISAEITRAKKAESELTTKIDSEATRATTTEQSLTKSLSEEVTRAKAAESTNATNISSETTRATKAESANATAISDETTRATKAETTLSDSISAETTRAKKAESANATSISTEVTRAKDAESTITASVTAETTRAKAAESVNATAISTETARAKKAEESNTDNIINEVTRAKAAEKTNADAISAETTARTSADTTLTTNLNAEITRAKGVEGTRVAGTYIKATNTLAQNDTALDTQVKANTAALATLNGTGDGSVSKQVSDGIAKIVANAPEDFDTLKEISDWITTHSSDASAMNTQIATNKTNIATNTSAISSLKTTVGGNTTSITNEVTRAKAAESANATNISALEKKVTTNTTNISTNTTNISTLTTNLGGHTVKSDVPANAKFTDTVYDETALKARVATNETNISTLTTNLGGHTVKSDVPSGAKFTDTVYDDTTLTAKVTTNTNNISTNATAISTETTRAKKAEEANTTLISTETTRAKAAEQANADAITTINGKISNINNTADKDKPISTATQTALDKKQDAISDLETIRTNASTAKTASEENASAIASIKDSELLNGIETYYALRRTGVQYSVQVPRFSSNQSSTCTKIGVNANLNYTPSTDTSEGTDDYENIPLFQWVHVIYKRYSDGAPYPIAIEGTKGYDELLATGSCDVGAMQMSFYVKFDQSNEAYDVITISDLPFDGAVIWSECKRADGSILPWCIGSSYYSSKGDDGLLHSLPNRKPERFQSYNNMTTNYPKKGTGYQGAGCERITFSYIFMTIKGGTKNIQTLFQGCTNYNFQYTCAVGESDVKRVIVTTSQGNNFYVGASVQIGTSGTNNDRGVAATYSVTDNAVVLSKESVTIDDTEYTAINLDLDSAITTTTSTLVSSIHWRSGSTDKVFSHRDGSYVSNTDARHPFRIQGREYRVGGWDVASDTMFWLTSEGRDVYVYPKGITHVQNSNTNAVKVGTIPITTDGWIGDIDLDPTTGVYWFATKGSSSGVGIGDYFWAGGTSTNTLREYLIGGHLGNGSHAGFYLYAGLSLSTAFWAFLGAD